jgi:magnesium-transporting ATPase (P-type)
MQVLAVDLGTDMLPGLGLGAERPEPDVMARPPRTATQRIIDGRLLVRAYLLLGGIEAAAAMTAYAFVLIGAGWHWGTPLATSSLLYRQSTTACLTAVVIVQVANVFACRSETAPASIRGTLKNRLILAGVAVELALVAAIDYTPMGHSIFGTAAIPWTAWLAPAPFALALIGFDRLTKRRRHDAATDPRSPGRVATRRPAGSPPRALPDTALRQQPSSATWVDRPSRALAKRFRSK